MHAPLMADAERALYVDYIDVGKHSGDLGCGMRDGECEFL